MSDWQSLESRARELDSQDELAAFRKDYFLPEGKIYLDGNSLGPMSRQSEVEVLQVLNDWQTKGIDGWLNAQSPWFYMAEEIGSMMAGLVGAKPEEVVAANSTTVNLHQLLATLYHPVPGKCKILVDSLCFPSDLYAIKSHLRLRGLDPSACIEMIRPNGERLFDEEAICRAFQADVALTVLPAVVYTTGQLLDIERISNEAQRRDIVIGWDCSHSVGAVPHSLDEWGADFAFWCTYKYLNGGPGATAGLYLNRRHFGTSPGLAGWFGSNKEVQFDMSPDLQPSDDARALQIGSPNILSMAPLMGSLKQIRSAGIAGLRAKSLALTGFMIEIADKKLARYGLKIITPRASAQRAGHVALAHHEAARICKALKDIGVIPDHRPPDIVRLAPAPLYNTFEDCVSAARGIGRIMEHRLYESYSAGREIVA